jgi:hypothetical protein
MPRSGFVLRQVGFSQSLDQIAAKANSLAVRNKASDRFAILQKHEGNILIVSTVNALSEIAGTFGELYFFSS